MKLKDLTGQTFERLTVMYRTEDHIYENGRKEAVYHCRCLCGNEIDVMASALRRGYSKSCGCLRRELARQEKRDDISRRLRIVWRNMNERCYDKGNKRYNRYGERGICVCDEWRGPEGLEAFISWGRNNGYSEGLTIERIDVNGNYCPSNCRWASVKEQANNRSTSRFIVVAGEKKTVAQWADQFNLKRPDIYYKTDSEIEDMIRGKMNR